MDLISLIYMYTADEKNKIKTSMNCFYSSKKKRCVHVFRNKVVFEFGFLLYDNVFCISDPLQMAAHQMAQQNQQQALYNAYLQQMVSFNLVSLNVY